MAFSANTSTSTLISTTRPTTTTSYCQRTTCGKNARCVTDLMDGYCICISGYYGNPDSGGDCGQDLGNTRFISPFTLSLPVDFNSDLLNSASDTYKSAHRSVVNSMLNGILLLLENSYNRSALLGVQLLKFEYCHYNF